MRSLTVPVLSLMLVSAVSMAQEFPTEYLSRVALREYPSQPCPPAPPKLEVSRDLPAEAKTLVTNFHTEADTIRKKAEDDIRVKSDQLAIALKVIQDQYTRDAKLDEAVAVRDLIRKLTAVHLPLHPYPGNLTPFRERIGETFYFEVAGRTTGSLWGTEVYTCDSDLGTAAVHIGALKDGETGIVQVTIVASPDEHISSTQNGVRSSSWGSYPASYTVQRWVGHRVK